MNEIIHQSKKQHDISQNLTILNTLVCEIT